ncbi:MAG: aldo/keto reductase [Akkermansiaceae bacterium]|nr:aldo/keto reductase [Akkermansiaceae bacterium]
MYTPSPTRYSQMPYRKCGKWGLKLPAISLGFWHNFGDHDDLDEGRRIMHRAFDRGITHFDFANNYGPPYGSAERNCGQILKKDFTSHRDELLIASKAGHDMWAGPYGEWGSRKYLLASLDQSLARLQLDYVDIFYSHRPDPDTPLEETMSALATAVNSGKALYAGISKYPLPMLKEAVAILKDMGVFTLIYQPPYNILSRGVEKAGILDYLHQEGIGCTVFSPLAQGMLTEKYLTRIPEGSRAARSDGFLTTDQVEQFRPQIQGLHSIAQERGEPLHHLALNWTRHHPAVTSTLVGARTVAQLDDLLDSLESPPLTAAHLAAINEIAPPTDKGE